MPAPVVPVRERVVAVEADRGEGIEPRWQYGSGLLIGGRQLLTAAHVVRSATVVHLYGAGQAHWVVTLEGALLAPVDGVDLALLAVPDAPELPAVPVGVVDRHGTSGDVWVERCWAVGFPAFYDVRRDKTASTVRAAAQVRGAIPPLSGEGERLLSFHVTTAPRALPDRALADSEWSGMSGAAVCAVVGEHGQEHNVLVGVVVEHSKPRGPSDITVMPLDRLADEGAVSDPAQWRERLGVLDWAKLPRLPAKPTKPEPPYRAVLREIRGHTDVLVGRENELSRLGAFATGDDEAFGVGSVSQSYLWLVAEPWGGKTALLAEAVHTLPPEVDVVAFFMVARESQASREHFLAAVVPQLASLLDENPPSEMDPHQFRLLWERAAQQAEARGRHLLLVVDGLDEDLRPGGYSVCGLLPAQQLGRHARVLVSSRPHLPVPDDVHPRHPLRSTRSIALTAYSPGDALKALAEQEIGALLTVDWTQPAASSLAVDVLGLLTAASGALSVDDLAAMLDTPPHIVHAFIAERAARSLRPEGPAQERRYTFAHQTLYEYCQRHDYVGGDAQYRQRLHAWADSWRERGWPAGDRLTRGTPRYLLDTYPATLVGDADAPVTWPAEPQRLATLVADIGWVDSAVPGVGVDRVLATLRTAARLVPADPRVVATLRLLELQAHHLRPPQSVDRPGTTATYLAWEALRHDLTDVAGAAADALRRCPPPQFVPVWTTERTSPHLVRPLGHHTGGVSAVAVTPDGRVVSGGGDGAVRLWNPAVPDDPGIELGRHDHGVAAVVATDDGGVLSGGRDGVVRLWDLAAPGAPGVDLGRHGGEVTAVAVTPDGRVVSGGGDGAVRLWDTAVPEDPGVELGRHDGGVQGLAVTPDGHVVSSDGDEVRLWDPAAPGTPGVDLAEQAGRVSALAVMPEGRAVSGGSDGAVRVWDPAAPGRPGIEVGRHERGLIAKVLAVAAAPQGRVVSGGWDGVVHLWDPATSGEPGRVLGHHDGGVTAVAVTPEGRVVSGGSDGAVRLWDPVAHGEAGGQPSRRRGWVTAVAVTPDGRVISGGNDGAVLWDPTSPGQQGRALGPSLFTVESMAAAPDGLVVAAGGFDGAVWLLDPGGTGETDIELGRHGDSVSAVAVTSDGRVVTGGWDRTLRLWDPAVPGGPGIELGRHRGRVEAVAVTAGGRVISGGREGTLQMWDPAAPGGPGIELGRHRGPVTAVAATRDEKIVSGGWDGTVRLWDPAVPGAPGIELGRHGAEVTAVSVAPGGNVISAGWDGALRLWDPAVPATASVALARHDSSVLALAVMPDLRVVAGATSGLTVFELRSAAPVTG